MKCAVFVLLSAMIGWTASTALADTHIDRPNFVFIQGEGQGWASTSVQLDPSEPESKSRSFLTPNLERLAREGVRFSNYYAPSPRCTPSRATYFTGISPAKLHMTFTSAGGDVGRRLIEPRVVQELPSEVKTIAEILKEAGYATAHFGKWHVGRANPHVHGFDESDGANSNAGPDNTANPNPKQAYGISESGIDFIQRQVKSGTPFYLQMSHYGGRSQDDAKPETFERVLKSGLGRDEKNIAAAAVALDMDITIGMVLDALDQLGIADNTYVIYTADHGTPGRNGPLSGGKGGLWDGGIRIPLLVRGPIAKHGAHTSALATGTDLVPTVADLAGVGSSVPAEVEGVSLKAVLSDPSLASVLRPQNAIVFHFPHYDKDSLGPVSAIISGNDKLVRVYEDDSRLLFDLSKDIGEQNNLANSRRDKVQELDAKLTDYLNKVGAQMPTARPTNQIAPVSASATKQKKARTDPIMTLLDANQDGTLTQSEWKTISSMLRQFDRDKDGAVSQEEIRAAP